MVGILGTIAVGALAAMAMLYQLGMAMLNAMALYNLASEARHLHERYQARLAALRGEAQDVDIVEEAPEGDVEILSEAALAA